MSRRRGPRCGQGSQPRRRLSPKRFVPDLKTEGRQRHLRDSNRIALRPVPSPTDRALFGLGTRSVHFRRSPSLRMTRHRYDAIATRPEPRPRRRPPEWARRLGASLLKPMTASWSGPRKGPTEYKVAARCVARHGRLPSVRLLPDVHINNGIRNQNDVAGLAS